MSYFLEEQPCLEEQLCFFLAEQLCLEEHELLSFLAEEHPVFSFLAQLCFSDIIPQAVRPEVRTIPAIANLADFINLDLFNIIL